MGRIYNPVQTRRRHSDAYRRKVFVWTWRDEPSVYEAARRHDLNANLVFKWRQRYRSEPQADHSDLFPIRVTSPADARRRAVKSGDPPRGKRTAYRNRDPDYFFLKLKAVFSGK